jgi:hypothetical protein
VKLNSFILLSIDNDSTDETLREVFIGNGAIKDLRKYIKDFILDKVENGKYRSKIELSDKLDTDNIEISVSAFLEDDSPLYKSINTGYLRNYINDYLKDNPGRLDVPDNYVMELIVFRIAEYRFEIDTKGLGYLHDFE